MTSFPTPAPQAVPPRTSHHPTQPPLGSAGLPLPARWALALERAPVLDRVTAVLGVVARLVPSTSALKAGPSGHALHPSLTDLPIGFWTSSMALDVIGGGSARAASQRLVGLGLLSAAPTIVTGLAEWQDTDREQSRVGVVHAALNATATVLYTMSYAARRQGAHARGVMLGFAAATSATAAGYLGGHLAIARKVGSRNEALDGAGDQAFTEPAI
jgi:uncharacterized membrane protein